MKSSAAIFDEGAKEKLKDVHLKMDDLVLNLQKHYLEVTKDFLDQQRLGGEGDPPCVGPGGSAEAALQAVLQNAQATGVNAIHREAADATRTIASAIQQDQRALRVHYDHYISEMEGYGERIMKFGEEIQGMIRIESKKIIQEVASENGESQKMRVNKLHRET